MYTYFLVSTAVANLQIIHCIFSTRRQTPMQNDNWFYNCFSAFHCIFPIVQHIHAKKKTKPTPTPSDPVFRDTKDKSHILFLIMHSMSNRLWNLWKLVNLENSCSFERTIQFSYQTWISRRRSCFCDVISDWFPLEKCPGWYDYIGRDSVELKGGHFTVSLGNMNSIIRRQ